MKKATIKDIARAAGVSPSTVSRVLSGGAPISEETSQRVREAARQLSYTPNTAAQCLRREKSRSIGVVFPDISGEFYASCASWLLKHARSHGYTVLFMESGPSAEAERDGLQALMERRVDGIIFIGDHGDHALIQDLVNRSVPVVTGDRHLPGIVSVIFNNRETMEQLTEALYDRGYRKFLYVGEPTEGQDNLKERFTGYHQALEAHADAQAASVFDKRLHEDKLLGSYELFLSELQFDLPEVIITSNDLIAQGIISAAHACHIRIPEELSVTGFDDQLSSAYFIPSVTTVHQDVEELARRCFDLLMALLDKKDAVSYTVRQQIIERQSARFTQNKGTQGGSYQ